MITTLIAAFKVFSDLTRQLMDAYVVHTIISNQSIEDAVKNKASSYDCEDGEFVIVHEIVQKFNGKQDLDYCLLNVKKYSRI